jgi:hypothetical protein
MLTAALILLLLGIVLSDRLCGLVVKVPGYRMEMCCVPVRYELNLCYLEESRPPLWSNGQSS